jgi:RNA polymerase sigma-70 factor (ECF subfamily)
LLEEAINDVFLVIWQSAGRYRGDASPSTWIMGIAYKKTLKMLQKENRATKSANAQPAEFESLHPHLELESAVAMLPDSQQAVVVLAYEFGYSYREIGDILNCPENTVKTRMFTARKALKSLLEA